MTLSGIIFLIATRCGQGPDKGLFELEVLNESSITMIDQLLGVDLASLANPIPDSVMDRIILNPDRPLPWQMVDDDRDGKPDRLLFLANLEVGEDLKVSAVSGTAPPAFTPRPDR